MKKIVFFLLFLAFLSALDLDNESSALRINKSNVFDYAGANHAVRTTDRMIHLVYMENEGKTSKILYTRSNSNGQTWAEPRVISEGYAYAKNPVILVDGGDKLSIVWENSGSIYITESLNKGIEWSTPFKVSGKFNDGKMPAAVLSNSNDIHLVWENAGSIFYRSYSGSLATWSTIYALNNAQKAAQSPVLTNLSNQQIVVAWIEQGEIICRALNLANGEWGKQEEISLDANKYLSTPGSCENPVIVADSADLVHCVWTSKQQILHRVRSKNYWSPIINRLSQRYAKGLSVPVITADGEGSIYCAFLEDNAVIIQQFNSSFMAWKKIRALKPKTAKILFSPLLVGNNGYNTAIFTYKSGYDLIWLEKAATNTAPAFLRYDSQAKFLEPLNAPKINSVANTNGYPVLNWSAPGNQVGFQIIISNRNQPADPLLYDSQRIDSNSATYTVDKFLLKDIPLYFFVRIFNEKGQWSEWSAPYLLKTGEDTAGPELEITSIEEDSLYLYSPNPETLYYGRGLEQPKEFVIRGKVVDRGSGIKKLTFSPAFGDAPPPLYDLTSEDWAVRYTIKSSDDPATIIITAYDNSGLSSTKIVSVVKDNGPPEPPAWVTIYPDKDFADRGVTGNKQDNDRTVYVSWVPAKDQGSGLRYHLMGTSAKWWQNSIHQPGDGEEGREGDNTFYVFAVDNVGNVSLPGTDKVFIDSLPPAKPELLANVTSGNYFYGTCSTDSATIYVNGVRDEVEIYAPGFWRYKHQLRDGQKELFNFQAVDKLGNKSEVCEERLSVDKTPPAVFYVEHNSPDKILRVNDTLVVLLKGEPKNQGSFTIDGLVKDAPLYDDGTRGDISADDGTYTGTYRIDTEMNVGKVDITGVLADKVGNSSSKVSLKPVEIDSSQPVVLDNFENRGDVYPWKNHCAARNISKEQDEFYNFDIPEGKGCLKVDYDFNGEQAWAGLASNEFLPKNLSGSRVYLNFWLKGSGSDARLYLYLPGKKPRNISGELREIEQEYSVSLKNDSWQKVSLPVDKRYLDDLEQVNKYQLFIIGKNEKEKGTFYLDDLYLSYLPAKKQILSSTVKYIPPAQLKTMKQVNLPPDNRGLLEAPYLQVELNPNPVQQGGKITVKINLPKNISAEEAVITWGLMNRKPLNLKLERTGQIWKGIWQVPGSFKTGEQFGLLFVKTSGGVLKKQFIYRVLPSGNTSLQDYINCVFYPHPLIPQKEAMVKILIPQALRPKTVGVFFGESKTKVYSTNLKKLDSAGGREAWQGSIVLPGEMQPGSYSAVIYIKTQDNRIIRRDAFYAVGGNNSQ